MAGRNRCTGLGSLLAWRKRYAKYLNTRVTRGITRAQCTAEVYTRYSTRVTRASAVEYARGNRA